MPVRRIALPQQQGPGVGTVPVRFAAPIGSRRCNGSPLIPPRPSQAVSDAALVEDPPGVGGAVAGPGADLLGEGAHAARQRTQPPGVEQEDTQDLASGYGDRHRAPVVDGERAGDERFALLSAVQRVAGPRERFDGAGARARFERR